VLGALAQRGEAVAASERGVLRSTMADGCCDPSGRLQCRRRRCCAGTAGVLPDARQHRREASGSSASVLGCYLRNGGNPNVAHAMRGTR
jgi:hypothetical protein